MKWQRRKVRKKVKKNKNEREKINECLREQTEPISNGVKQWNIPLLKKVKQVNLWLKQAKRNALKVSERLLLGVSESEWMLKRVETPYIV